MLESTIIVSQENFRQLEEQRDSKGARQKSHHNNRPDIFKV